MIFEDRIQVNPRLFRLKDPRTNEIVDFEIQDLLPEEIVQEGIEISAAYLNSLMTYSENERIIGYWINGKPIYRKVISITTTATQSGTDANIPNLEQVVNLYGQTSTQLPVNFYYAPANTYISTFYASGTIQNVCSQGYAGQTANVIIEYTKTTD